jgi:2-oxoglutarate dehydrogenase E2 component (dihydrolipoamide succinyltransferase)
MGESISSGLLAKWHVGNGDLVKKDDPLFELETDKITSEGTAEAAGRITLKTSAGSEVKIGEIVATIDPSEVSLPEIGTQAASSSAAKDEAQAPVQSPAVRRIAAETGVDPSSVAGTGKAGRVTKGDMLVVAGAEKPAGSAAPRQTRRKLTPLRLRIAERLVAAQQEAAMLTTFNEVDMSAVMALRARYQDDFVKKNGIKLGFMSFFTKAVVNALIEVPCVNAQIDGDTIVENHFYDIGIAVSTEKGLMVPVIRDCDRLGMAQIEIAIGDAAKRAREGKITLDDLEGGVFTITNGGIFGSMLSTPIINPPQCAILGLHAILERPVAVGGQVVVRPMMYLALSYDHRLVDGRDAVTFLIKVKQAIEDPARLLLSV